MSEWPEQFCDTCEANPCYCEPKAPGAPAPAAAPLDSDKEWVMPPMGKEVAAFADKWEQEHGSASYKPYTFAVHFAASKLARLTTELEQVKAESLRRGAALEQIAYSDSVGITVQVLRAWAEAALGEKGRKP